MAAENKKFTVKDDDTSYILSQKGVGKFLVWWYDEDKKYHEVDYLEQTVEEHFSSGNWKFVEEVQVVEIKPQSALDKQVSGNHYKDCGIQPIEYIHANNLSYFQGNVVKYVTRYKDKAGKADLEKAIHYLELMIELEYPDAT